MKFFWTMADNASVETWNKFKYVCNMISVHLLGSQFESPSGTNTITFNGCVFDYNSGNVHSILCCNTDTRIPLVTLTYAMDLGVITDWGTSHNLN